MIPNKLKIGGHIRVIAPARSYKFLAGGVSIFAKEKLEKLGFQVSFGKNVEKIDEFSSSSVEARLEDLHNAFMDKTVDAILTVIGGYNSNQLLRYIDYELIKNNPKILCGYSDITALCNAIYFKTGLVTYLGPHFSTWGMKKEMEYSEEYFAKCCMADSEYDVKPSNTWSDDLWFFEQDNRNIIPNKGYWVMNKGQSEGRIVGGNLSTFNLLFGTEYISLKDSILLIEDTSNIKQETFDQMLQSIIHQLDFNGIKGILIGRFQVESKISQNTLKSIINSKKELLSIPIIANVDFGHTNPLITLPIGGNIEIYAENGNAEIRITKH